MELLSNGKSLDNFLFSVENNKLIDIPIELINNPDIILKDQLPIHTLKTGVLRILQDFVAPFYQFLKVNYQLEYTEIDSQFNPKLIKLRSYVITSIFGAQQNRKSFEITLLNGRINEFVAKVNNTKIIANRIEEIN